MANDARSLSISGIRVSFPHKPYPSQLSMMAKIIKGIEKKENALLESPTGSGKSLALLCSVLAWQRAERARQTDQLTGQCTCARLKQSAGLHSVLLSHDGRETPPPVADTTATVTQAGDQQHSDTASPCTSTQQSIGAMIADSDFKSVPRKYRKPGASLKRSHQPISYDDDTNDFTQAQANEGAGQCKQSEWRMELRSLHQSSNAMSSKSLCMQSPSILQAIPARLASSQVSPSVAVKETLMCDFCVSMNEAAAVGKKKAQSNIPKVYFGTRTHKQIAQIVRELKKTSYHDTKMCVLGSREHGCIHPEVSRGKHKNEECQKLLSVGQNQGGGGCRFFHSLKVRSYGELRSHGFETAWDLEELVGFGQKTGMCPYFITRNLLTDADIVFCPYNYLIDLKIRQQIGIDVEDQVVVLDEAHNIEDFSRDAASFKVTLEELKTASEEMGKMVEANMLAKSHGRMRHMCDVLVEWIDINKSKVAEHDFETQYKVVTGPEMVAFLTSKGISAPNLSMLRDQFSTVASYAVEPQKFLSVVTTSSLTVLEGILIALAFIIGHGGKYALDYRVAVGKVLSVGSSENREPGNWRRRRSMKTKTWEYSMFFWCLNPAVAFTELSTLTRCVVVSSGTLSPLNTFSSELGTNFPVRLEASHVIKQEQVWIGSLGAGPSGLKMDGRFKASETFEYQDEVGEIVLRVCKVIPFGVLCFVPSYSHLEKFYMRWQRTGLMERLVQLKCVLAEPRGSEKADFEEVLHEFYEIVQKAGESGARGALLMAVCRGKVSEGLDFADNNARAVITVGIPYPSIKDVQVELKRAYNDQYAAQRGLMRGGQWYETQAYRALNQALGRCLRHRCDWGALLMVDERFGQSDKYIRGLSKWIRQQVRHFTLCDMALASLERFSNVCMAGPCLSDSNTSMVADSSVVIPTSPIKSIASDMMVNPAVVASSRDSQESCGNFTAPSPAFVTVSQIISTVVKPNHTNPPAACEGVACCNSDKSRHTSSLATALPATQTDGKMQSIPDELTSGNLKTEGTPLLFPASETDEPVNHKTCRQTSPDQSKATSSVSKTRNREQRRENGILVNGYFRVSGRHTNVRMGRKRDVERLGGGNCHKRAHGEDSCLLSVFEEEDELKNTRKQFVYPDTKEKVQTKVQNDCRTLQGTLKCKTCHQQLVADSATMELSSHTVGVLTQFPTKNEGTACFVCSVDDLSSNCIPYRPVAMASWPLFELNCMWSETDGLSYMLLTCSTCATKCGDACAPLIGVRVVGYSQPSLQGRMNQVECRPEVACAWLMDVHNIDLDMLMLSFDFRFIFYSHLLIT